MKQSSLIECFNAKKIKKHLSEVEEVAEIRGREIKRPWKNGKPMVHASELYENKEIGIEEKEAFRALNLLVDKNEAGMENKNGYLWYYLKH